MKSPRQPKAGKKEIMVDKDGKECCFAHMEGKCDKGDACKYSHFKPVKKKADVAVAVLNTSLTTARKVVDCGPCVFHGRERCVKSTHSVLMCRSHFRAV